MRGARATSLETTRPSGAPRARARSRPTPGVKSSLRRSALLTRVPVGLLSGARDGRQAAARAKRDPLVVDTRSQVLDVGRKARFHTEPSGSRWPSSRAAAPPRAATGHPAWPNAHHDQPWSKGGDTSVKNGRLLRPRHARAHDPSYEMSRLPGVKVASQRRR